VYRGPVKPTRLLAAVLLGLTLLASAPAAAATIIEPPVATCSGQPEDPCTAKARALDADVKRAREIALSAQSGPQKRTFRAGPRGLLVVLQALLGVALLLGLGFVFSADRKAIRWRPVLWGLGLQLAFALIVLNPVVGDFFFSVVDRGVRQLLVFAEAGMTFVLQGVEPHTVTHVTPQGHWVVDDVMAGRVSPAMKTIAFWVLPTIIFFSALMTLLYHLGIMQLIVRGIAAVMRYMLGTSGAETLSCAGNVFLGQTEAPLLVKPFVKEATPSELFAIMTGGFATVAGGVLALYVAVLRDIPGIAGHLVAASFMGAPGALAMAKLMFPETGTPVTAGGAPIVVERPDANAIEALARGATEGMTLLLNVIAMLIAFVAMVFLVNGLLGLVGDLVGVKLTLERLLGWILSPLAWAMGVPWADAGFFGELLGKKLVLTELLAFLDLQRQGTSMSERSAVMASYALCGFANIASIGIQIGGIGGLAPGRRGDLARLGLRAMFAGAMVSCLSAIWAGMIYQVFRG
jgi:CNT family concentrative nucleoside transporter